MIHISERIRYLRKINNISQDELASGINASRGNVGDWERGKTKPGSDALVALARFFNVSTDFILTGKIYNPKNISITDLGEKIKILRKDNNLDRSTVAKKLLISEEEYTTYEEGNLFPPDEIIVGLTLILGCDLVFLLDEKSKVLNKNYYFVDSKVKIKEAETSYSAKTKSSSYESEFLDKLAHAEKKWLELINNLTDENKQRLEGYLRALIDTQNN